MAKYIDLTGLSRFLDKLKSSVIAFKLKKNVAAEMDGCSATGSHSVAEGWNTTAIGNYSHAEGLDTTASGISSHAEGWGTSANGNYSHAEGNHTTARNTSEHAEGRYNVSNKATITYGSSGNTQHSVGIGTSDGDRKNAFEIMQNGDAYVYGVGKYDGNNIASADTAQQAINTSAKKYTITFDANDGGKFLVVPLGANTEITKVRIDVTSCVQSSIEDAFLRHIIYDVETARASMIPKAYQDGPNFAESLSIRRKADIQDSKYTLFMVLPMLAMGVTGEITVSCLDGHALYHDEYNDNVLYLELGQNITNAKYGRATPISVIDKTLKYMTSVTWANLKSLRDSSGLTPGMQYRITDYQTKTVQDDTQAAGHQFDVIVTATGVNKLSEEAKAIQHSSATTDYFYANKLEAWKIWYCLDNDTTRFAWADSGSTGRGVIYRMIDEFNNDCPYDFKNIQFKRKISLSNGYPQLDLTSGIDTWVFTFAGTSYHITNDTWSDLKDGSLESPYGHESDEGFSTYHDNAMGKYMKLYDDEDYTKCGIQYLNDNVFLGYWEEIGSDDPENFPYYIAHCSYRCTFGNDCAHNTFGDDCAHNTFGNNCYSNTFGGECSSNTFGNDCGSNTFGNGCNNNTFGNNCAHNTFEYDCYSNTFGNNCTLNTFGNSCHSNTFEYDCYSNTFEYGCYSNTFGNSCYSNTFGNECASNTFGNYCASVKFGRRCIKNTFGSNIYTIGFGSYSGGTCVPQNYYRNIIVEDNNYSIYLRADVPTDESHWIQNKILRPGTNREGTEYEQLGIGSVNDTFTTTYHAYNDVDESV